MNNLKISDLLLQIKQQNPLILNLTNEVSMEFVANGLLSLGASPIMSKAIEECEALVVLSNALVINIGTLNQAFIEHCFAACQSANAQNIPIILDPVGAGATQYRTQMCWQLLDAFQFHIIRGNASEILALSKENNLTKGVDSLIQTPQAISAAQQLAAQFDTTVVISGKMDAVVTNHSVSNYHRGHELMPKVTGTGCLLTAVIAAFQAVCENSSKAAVAAVQFYGVCGEIAANHADGPGSFKCHFIDALSIIPEHIDALN